MKTFVVLGGLVLAMVVPCQAIAVEGADEQVVKMCTQNANEDGVPAGEMEQYIQSCIDSYQAEHGSDSAPPAEDQGQDSGRQE